MERVYAKKKGGNISCPGTFNLLSQRNFSINQGFIENKMKLLRTISFLENKMKLLQTTSNFFYWFGTILFAPSYSGTKQNFYSLEKLYPNKIKMFKLRHGFLKT